MVVNEEIDRLKKWEEKIYSQLENINKIRKNKEIIYYSISGVSSSNKIDPYITPIRITGNKIISGCVVGSQIEAIISSKCIINTVDYLLLDVEKKIPMQITPHKSVFEAFNLDRGLYIQNSKTVSGVEFGNISSAVRKTFPEKKIINFKPNDLTVESIWSFLSHKFHNFSGLKIAIMGTGNIGFKIALKLVESGCDVNLYRRDETKGNFFSNCINLVKHKNTLARAEFFNDPIQASTLCNAIIGTSKTDTPVITDQMIQVMQKKGLLIDCGKGNISEDAIKLAMETKINIYRTDVTSGIISFVNQASEIKSLVNEKTGRKEILKGIFVISGGVFGNYEDIIVDNYSKPKLIYGMANGKGNFIIKLSPKQVQKIKKIKDKFNIG